MRFAPFVLAVLLALAAGAPPAQAVTLPEIVALSRAGLADEVLLALIEVEARVFPVDAETIKWLHDSGVSPRVIEAIVRSGRSRLPDQPTEQAVSAAPALPEPVYPSGPQVIVIEREAPPVVVAVPVYVAAPVVRVSRRAAVRAVDADRLAVGTGFNTPVVSTGFGVPHTSRPAPSGASSGPVYWGWGGTLRPDAWKPAWEAGRPRR